MAASIQTPAKVLARIIDTTSPQRILCCGELAQMVAQTWVTQHPDAHCYELDPAQDMAQVAAYADSDLALISAGLQGLSHAQGEQFLGSLRNYGTQCIAVLVPDQADWSFVDFIALGFRRHARLEQEGMVLYSYNLESYNHERRWNNPRHWANPQMWGKAWW